MRTILITLLTTVLMATNAYADPPTLGMLQGSEVRMSVDFGGLNRSEVLHLHPDGTFSGNYERRRPVTRGSWESWTGSMNGRWSYAGDELCFEGRGLEYRGRSCYRLTKSNYSPRQWYGAHSGTGDIWSVFVYPRGS